jgi:hypothetical protein
MNVLTHLRRLFGRNDTPSVPTLRNKPGGMAWIKPYGREYGAIAIAGQAVRTVRLIGSDMWEIDPQPSYRIGPMGVESVQSGVIGRPGDTAHVTGLSDDLLEPWKDIGDDERDESLSYLPPVPASLVNIVKERL